MSCEDENINLNEDSDCSDASYHSLESKVENLNIGEADFVVPDFKKPTQGISSSEDLDEKFTDCSDHEDEETKKKEDVYFVDIEYLKDLELTLSPEQRDVNHIEAKEKKDVGNDNYKNSNFESAALKYTDGLRTCPLSFHETRSILYANRAAARSQISEPDLKACKVDCTEAIELNPSYHKAILRRANLCRRLDDLDEALSDYKKILEFNPMNAEAREAISVLPALIEEKNERLKTEMMGKLKDIGNLILKPFGLSTTNFAMEQDGKSGGYNIQFKQS